MQGLTQPIIRRMIKLPLLFWRFFNIKLEAKKAANLLRDKHYDLVYSNTSSIVFGGYLGLALGCKQIWHIREFRKEDHQIGFFLGDKYLMKFINHCADKVLFVSQSVAEKHNGYIELSKMVVTYNSYSQDFIDPKDSFNYHGILNVLLAGDIKPSKGQLISIQAVERANQLCGKKKFVLHLAGKVSNKAYHDQIKEYISENKLEQYIVMYGQVKDMKSLREKMDIGIVASTNEAFGRTTIEGMLSMLVMIGRNTGGTREQIRHMETGMLYDGSVQNLAECLVWIDNNRAEMERMAKAGFNESVELHTKGRCAKITEDVIDTILC